MARNGTETMQCAGLRDRILLPYIVAIPLFFFRALQPRRHRQLISQFKHTCDFLSASSLGVKQLDIPFNRLGPIFHFNFPDVVLLKR
jgi:hypothetical protein